MIDFSLKRFLSFFDCFMPAALSRFGTLGEGSRTLGSLADVELASSISLPLTVALNYKVHSLLLELEIKTNETY